MNVLQNTPERLILEKNPLGLSIVVMIFTLALIWIGLSNFSAEPLTGLAAMIIGPAVFIWFGIAHFDRVRLDLDREAGSITLNRLAWGDSRRVVWDLSDLDRAELQTFERRQRKTYRAALIFDAGMDAGAQPIARDYEQSESPEATVTIINRWLDSARPEA